MISKLRMLCIGTATQDVFLRGPIFKPVCDKDGNCYENLPLGEKLDVEEVIFTTGGNAPNAATTFARQGLDVEFMGILGTEPAAGAIMRELDAEGIGTRYLNQDEKFTTS